MTTTERYETPLDQGLTADEVAQRVAAGLQNDPLPPLTRSVKQIFRDNLLTLFNLINVLLGVLVLVTGSYKNLLFLGVVVVNTGIGIFQEIRSKRQVDKLALLSEGTIDVLRDGQLTARHQDDIVSDDLLELHRGDQIPVDGLIRDTAGLEVDESQITGESTPILKATGHSLISGSVLLGRLPNFRQCPPRGAGHGAGHHGRPRQLCETIGAFGQAKTAECQPAAHHY